MKNKCITLAVCLSVSLVLGCANSGTSTSASSSDHANTIADTPQVRKGMTKAQVIKAWGEPGGRQVSGSSEVWTYGGQRWKRMIPYAGPFMNVQTSKVVFGSNGRVKDFRITDHGDAMSDMEGYSGGHSEL
jgi:outer membrane protein assembly factor BamE (lipoprotein component of BamABCDE complex)